MRINVNIIIFSILSVLITNCSAITLSQDGKTDYVIALSQDATAPQKTAASELQVYLGKITGADFAIKSLKDIDAGTPKIFVGDSPKVRSLLKGLNWKDLMCDGIVIKTIDNDLILAGGRPRGTIYAVYTFLEDVAGVRWWSYKPDEEFVPHKKTLDIGNLDVVYTPQFRYREVLSYKMRTPFTVRMKVNGHWMNIPKEYGGHMRLLGFCHTLYQLIPAEKYAKTHPEWYSLIDGKRVFEKAQMCLSNKELQKEVVKNALEWIRENPHAGMIAIMQNDSFGQCECENCKKMRGEGGNESDVLIKFVNAVAEEINKEFPDFQIVTLAYNYTRQPPKNVKPGKNVVVEICSSGCTYDTPLDSPKSAKNRKFCNEVKSWNKICSKILFWDYNANFRNYTLPHPSVQVLGDNIRFFAEHGGFGVFEQCDAKCPVGDFCRLKAWVAAHLLWNPKLDDKKLIAEFLDGYYGPAGKYLGEYLKLINDAAVKSDVDFTMANKDFSFMTLDVMNESTKLFDKAEAAVANDPELLARVHRERLPLTHTWVKRYNDLKEESKKSNKPFLAPKDPKAACDEVIETVNKVRGWFYEGASPGWDSFRFYLNNKKSGTETGHYIKDWYHYVLEMTQNSSTLKVYDWISDDPSAYKSVKPVFETTDDVELGNKSLRFQFVNNNSRQAPDKSASNRDTMYLANVFMAKSDSDKKAAWTPLGNLKKNLKGWDPKTKHTKISIKKAPVSGGPKGSVVEMTSTFPKGKYCDMIWKRPVKIPGGGSVSIAFDLSYIKTGNANYGHGLRVLDAKSDTLLKVGHFGDLKSGQALKYEKELRDCVKTAK